MTVTTAPARRTTLALAANRDAVAAAALGLISIGLLVTTWATWGNLGADTGYDFVAGSLVAHGQVPYADFTYYYGPLAPALLGLVAAAGGSGVMPPLLLGVVISGFIIATSYLLARLLTSPGGGFIAGAIAAAVAFAPTNFSFVSPHAYSAPLGLLAVLVALVLLHRRAAGGGPAWAMAAGAAVGLAALTRPEFAAAAVLAAAAWLIAPDALGRSRAGELARVGAGAILIPLAVYGPFIAAIGWHRLVAENLYPEAQLRVAGYHVASLSAPMTVSSFGSLLGHAALYMLGVGALLALARALASERLRPAAVGCLGVVCVLAVMLLALRPDTVRWLMTYVYAWIPVAAGATVVVSAVRLRRQANIDTRTLLALAVALSIVSAKTYAAFLPFSTVPQSAVYAAPLAAVLLARLHLSELAPTVQARRLGMLWLAFLALAGTWLTVWEARMDTVAVSGPGGTLYAAPPDGRMYASALAWIDAHSRPGDPVLIAPQLTALYTLSGRRDPLPQISLLPGVLPDRKANQAAVSELQQSGVRLAVIDTRSFTEYGQTTFGRSFDQGVAAWLDRNFIHVRTLTAGVPGGRQIELWIRRRS
jgi:Dolichyl-phosphate-mannose-protein mannosyltransferase